MKGRPGQGKTYDRGIPRNAKYASQLFGLLCIGSAARFYCYNKTDDRLVEVFQGISDYVSLGSPSFALEWWTRVYSELMKYVGTQLDSPLPP